MEKTGSGKSAGAIAAIASTNGGFCDSCRHGFCGSCDQWSVQQAYSDYWICHCCGGLNPRRKQLH
jgi:hypothetical protein